MVTMSPSPAPPAARSGQAVGGRLELRPRQAVLTAGDRRTVGVLFGQNTQTAAVGDQVHEGESMARLPPQCAEIIVRMAHVSTDGPTGGFFSDAGPVPG